MMVLQVAAIQCSYCFLATFEEVCHYGILSFDCCAYKIFMPSDVNIKDYSYSSIANISRWIRKTLPEFGHVLLCFFVFSTNPEFSLMSCYTKCVFITTLYPHLVIQAYAYTATYFVTSMHKLVNISWRFYMHAKCESMEF